MDDIRPLTVSEFAQFRTLVENETGIFLSDVKLALVNARLLSRIRELGMRTFSEYYERATQSPDLELARLINAICTDETHFFREPAHFNYLTNLLLPRLEEDGEQGLRPRRIRVWSAACSSGEEPYSLAMLLRARLPSSWAIEIHASDLSTKVLEKAVKAVYPMQRLADVPDDLTKRFLLKGTGDQEGKFRVGPEARNLVHFHQFNLLGEPPAELGVFDMVFCRNVLMYFRSETRQEVVGRLLCRLARGGHFFIGHAETLHDFDERLKSVAPTIYVFSRGN